MSADPRIMAEAHTIDQLSYREIAELAYFGARVLHPKTIRPVIEAGIALRVLNTFNPESPGTAIVSELLEENGGRVKAVTAIPGQRLVTVRRARHVRGARCGGAHLCCRGAYRHERSPDHSSLVGAVHLLRGPLGVGGDGRE